ncbi:MAG: cbb3-type cytochrome oxidase assembly protein CcoS [Pseudomonadota bacterium]
MTIIGALIPISLFLGGLGLLAFGWCLKAGQFDDLDGDQHRALFRDDPDI